MLHTDHVFHSEAGPRRFVHLREAPNLLVLLLRGGCVLRAALPQNPRRKPSRCCDLPQLPLRQTRRPGRRARNRSTSSSGRCITTPPPPQPPRPRVININTIMTTPASRSSQLQGGPRSKNASKRSRAKSKSESEDAHAVVQRCTAATDPDPPASTCRPQSAPASPSTSSRTRSVRCTGCPASGTSSLTRTPPSRSIRADRGLAELGSMYCRVHLAASDMAIGSA